MSSLSTHILNQGEGKPAQDVEVLLQQLTHDGWIQIGSGRTDADGRIRDFGIEEPLTTGIFQLDFDTGDYFEQLGTKANQVDSIVLNEVLPPPFPELEAWKEARSHFDALPEAQALCDRAVNRAHAEVQAQKRLLSGTGLTPIPLPFLFDRKLSIEDLRVLATELGGEQ